MRSVWLCVLLASILAAAQTATTTSLTASPDPAMLGHAVTLTATVTSGASGKVTFYDGTTVLGVSTISGGQATWTTVLLPVGARSLRAHYGGDAEHAASTSAMVAETVNASPSFALGMPTGYPVGLFPYNPVVGDFNGDGKPDLVLTNLAGSNIIVLLGTGNGGFQPAVPYTVNGTVNSLAVADFNGDGKADLVVSGATAILLGNGDGTFQNAIPISVGSAANGSVAAADFNGDGKADVVFGDNYGNVIVLIGNGDGTFQAPTSFAVPGGDYTVTLLAGDFNGDGIPDLCVIGGITVSIWLGNGDGTFRPAAANPVGTNIFAVLSADLNRDGKLDLVAINTGEIGVEILLGNGDGTFQSPVTYGTFAVFEPAVGDINGDGKLDLTASTGGAIAIFYGNGDGTFQAPITLPFLDDNGPQILADFNGDGATDLAIFLQQSGLVDVYLGGAVPDLTVLLDHGNGLTQGQTGAEYHITITNVGTFASLGIVSVTDSLPTGITATAIAGSGWACTLASVSCTRSDSLPVGASYPAITVTVNVASSLTGSVTNVATVSGGGDANASNNSATDVSPARTPTSIGLSVTPAPSTLSQLVSLTAMVTLGATGKVTFYDGAAMIGIAALTGGQATFSTRLLLPGTHSLTARYDGDSNFGPSLSSISMQTVSALTASGYHSALSFQVLPPNSVAVADFNRDGNPDVVTAGNEGISVLLGNGDGSLQSAVTYSVAPATSAQTMRVGDFNGDGIPDVIASAALASGNYALFVFLGKGDGTFQAPLISAATGLYYNVFAVGDFDGDGRLDVATVSSLGNGVDILRGNGDGTLRAPLTTMVNLASSNIQGLLVADLNLDGKADLIVNAVFNSARALILLGNGDGTFAIGPAYTLYNGNGPTAIAVADLNGDGKPDLVQLSRNGIDVYLGNGNGTLSTSAINSNIGYDPGFNFVVGDFNGDGKLDVAFFTSATITTSVAEIVLGNGDGSFSTLVDLTVNGNASTSTFDPTVALADFNGDGIPDLVAVDSSVLIFLGGQFSGLQVTVSHTGVLIPGQTLTYTINVTNPTFVTTSGVITVKDTLPTGLTATAISGGPLWNCTLASLTCTTSNIISPLQSFIPITVTVMAAANLMPSTLTNMASVTYANVTNTASDPTAAGLPTTTSLTVSPNPATLGAAVTLTATVSSGTGTITFQVDSIQLGTAILSGKQASLTTRLIPAGLHKIIATYSGDSSQAPSSSMAVVLTVTSAPATSLAALANLTTGAGPTAVLVSDLNGDGKMDLLTVNATANTVSVFMGNGGGTFQARTDYSVGMQPSAAVIADFNGDGTPDIAVANQSSGTITILSNNGNGTFEAGAVIITASPGNIVAADFDGDGKVDLAVISAGNVSFFFGNGDGTFRQGTGGFYSCCGSALAVGDFNGDGKPDLAAGGYVYPNNGDGTFGVLVGVGAAMGWAVGDLNRDGNSDLAGPAGSGLETILGNGNGKFKGSSSYIAGLDPYSLTLADINGDGKLDAVVSNSGSNTISVLLGNGDGTLQPAVAYTVGNSPRSVAAGDFNGDGRTDLAVANYSSNTVSILLGGTPQTSNAGIFRQGFLWVLDVDGNQKMNIPPDSVFAFGGIPGDIPITGDWNGDGRTKIGIYRSSNGLWILDTNGNGVIDAGDAVFNLHIGTSPGDIPVVGDWNGDGRSKVGYFRQGFLWILDTNGNHTYDQSDQVYAFGGIAGDVPVVGDWTGTGTSKIGIFRQGFLWILDANGNGNIDGPDFIFAYGGIPGDVPVVGDWTGAGITQVGIFRQGFLWALDANGDHQIDAGDFVFGYGGIPGDIPVVGKW